MTQFRELWKRAFGDTKQYIEYYFSEKVPYSQIVENWEGKKLCSMAFFTPYEAYLYGKAITLSYIVGVATDRDFRHQGRMTKVLEEGISREKEKGSPLVFLSPADPVIYEPLGFQSVYWRETLLLKGEGTAYFEVIPWNELTPGQKENVSFVVEDILQRQQFDLRLKHSVPYYEKVNKEMQALGGEVLTFWCKGRLFAVANWICEEEKNEVTEWIGVPEGREELLQTLQWYVDGDVWIEDTYFLREIQLTNIEWFKQKHPYLMVRMLENSMSLPKHCYVNDIT